MYIIDADSTSPVSGFPPAFTRKNVNNYAIYRMVLFLVLTVEAKKWQCEISRENPS